MSKRKTNDVKVSSIIDRMYDANPEWVTIDGERFRYNQPVSIRAVDLGNAYDDVNSAVKEMTKIDWSKAKPKPKDPTIRGQKFIELRADKYLEVVDKKGKRK